MTMNGWTYRFRWTLKGTAEGAASKPPRVCMFQFFTRALFQIDRIVTAAPLRFYQHEATPVPEGFRIKGPYELEGSRLLKLGDSIAVATWTECEPGWVAVEGWGHEPPSLSVGVLEVWNEHPEHGGWKPFVVDETDEAKLQRLLNQPGPLSELRRCAFDWARKLREARAATMRGEDPTRGLVSVMEAETGLQAALLRWVDGGMKA